MALFGGFLGPNFFKCCPILMKFSPGVVFKKKKLYFKNLWKIQIFTRTVDNQNSDFWFNFDFPFPLKMAEIKKIALTQNVSHRAILISQNQGPIKALSSQEEDDYLLLYFGYFFRKPDKTKGQNVRIKIWKSYFTNTVPGHYSVKKSFVPLLSSFVAIGAKGRFCKILTHFLKFGCFSR